MYRRLGAPAINLARKGGVSNVNVARGSSSVRERDGRESLVDWESWHVEQQQQQQQQ
jgi:hypothetical protein